MLAAAFLIDWTLNLSVLLRSTVLVGWCAAGVWAIRRFAWPLLRIRESEQDVALLVEQQHKIDSDLVAALQFEQPIADRWGSARLEQAVIDYVAEFSPSLDVYQGFSWQPLPRRIGVLGLTLVLLAGAALLFPGHAAAFWNRFLLGSAHYPTRTRIAEIVIHGQSVPVFSNRTPAVVRVPYGQPIRVQVTCEGEIPGSGLARLSGVATDAVNDIPLTATSDRAQFQGEITHVADSFRIRCQFGDAQSDATEVEIIPLPLVDLTWKVTPPTYAAALVPSVDTDSGARQFAVLEGSSARLTLVCSNKSLESARIVVKGVDAPIELVSSSAMAAGVQWLLPAGTLFESVREPIHYEIQVRDRDGLTLDPPMTGQVRLKSDRVPRIVASAVTRQVLPTATPRLDYAAGDDFGVARIVAVVQISREDGTTTRHEVVSRAFQPEEQPQTIVRGQIPVPLSTYGLQKGDEVKVTLEVTDWRGASAGQTGAGESVTFSVTDLNGILAQTGDEDKKTARQLDEILRRELGISGEKSDRK